MNLKKKVFIVVFILLNIYGLLCGVIYFFQENLIFMPSFLPQEHAFEMKNSFEEINLKSSDGAQLKKKIQKESFYIFMAMPETYKVGGK
jgi:regulatory protein YycI of two-component signal transduction system YycFG